MPLFAGMFAVLGSTAALIVYACWNCHDYGARHDLSLRDFFSVFWTAVVSWFTYNRQENVAGETAVRYIGYAATIGGIVLLAYTYFLKSGQEAEEAAGLTAETQTTGEIPAVPMADLEAAVDTGSAPSVTAEGLGLDAPESKTVEDAVADALETDKR